MQASQVQKLTDEEITVELRNLGRKLFDMRTQSITEKIEDVSQFTKVRRDIARLKTQRRARQLAQQEQ